ncbi:uncharacterized protein LOC129918488 [Episyrphus balteatus]|uniref:uncharacterized protein LOC129918488 n=1 Tax=Episyrphus balteatus TaxID=286459 RepID=UPI002484FB5D|nr:uncharacterized protein LOC129918488 [Episyrphus balteatus]
MSKDSMSDHKAEYYLLNAKLCRLVQENPCMYDRSAPNYLKKDYVERAWTNIAREVNDTVGSCKERWRNIRTAYARSVNIYKSPCGPNRHKRYYLHDELQFLTKHIAPGLPSIPIRVLTPTELEEMHENSRQSIDVTDESSNYQINLDSPSPPPQPETIDEQVQEDESDHEQERDTEPEQETDRQPESESQPVNEELPVQAKKRRRNNSDEISKEIVPKTQKRDLDSDFLQSLLPDMKIMNYRQKILFKGKIFQALEEVFNDPKDFPRREEAYLSQKSSFAAPTPVTGRSLTRQSFGNKTFAERRDKQPEAPSKNNNRLPMVQLAQAQNESVVVVKQENEEVFVED